MKKKDLDKYVTVKELHEVVNKAVENLAIIIQKSFADLHREMNQRFADVYKRFDEVDSRFDKIEFRMGSYDRRIESLEDKMRVVNTKLHLF